MHADERDDTGNGTDQDANIRQTTFSLSEQHRRRSFELEDKRWSASDQRWDWIKLLIMMALMIGWMLVVYFFEPGLR